MNRLLFGDNLRWLRDRTAFPDESVDLVYLDPPFNSNATYNVLFREQSGAKSQAQFHAFTDTWHWVDAEPTYRDFLSTCQLASAIATVEALHSVLKTSAMMAYVAMMAPRLVELHRVLKRSGSLYLHCDPTASHYLKMVLDSIFGADGFRNEIVWKRTPFAGSSKSMALQLPRSHDVLLFYTKGDDWTWNAPTLPYSPEYLARFKWDDDDGRGPYRKTLLKTYSQETFARLKADNRLIKAVKQGAKWSYKQYLSESPGFVQIDDVWIDINALNPMSKERLSYPTQKPLALLDRIIKTSSNEGDIVLDPFCGCGTTVASAQRLKREWVGIDITYLAINLIKRRLESAFGKKKAKYSEGGQPADLSGARQLAQLDRFQFQQWALNLVDALPLKPGPGKGADRGVDGMLFFHESKTERRRILVQVKSGGVSRSDVATLIGDVANQKAVAGILITLDPPTTAMKKEAVEAERYVSKLWKKDYPKIQLLTIGGLLNGSERPNTPPLQDPFAKAPTTDTAEQIPLVAEHPADYDPDPE